MVLHLHWLNGVTEHAETAEEAASLAAAFLARLDALRAHGGRIAWTIHNALPHDVRFEDEAVLVRRGVVERAAMVHALAASTPAAVAPWFEIPADRLVVIPHPSYAGVYPTTATRDGARFELRPLARRARLPRLRGHPALQGHRRPPRRLARRGAVLARRAASSSRAARPPGRARTSCSSISP